MKKNITYDICRVKRLFFCKELCKKNRNNRFIDKYPANGRVYLFASGRKKEVKKTPIKKTILKASTIKAFLLSNHKETQYAVETIAIATTIPCGRFSSPSSIKTVLIRDTNIN